MSESLPNMVRICTGYHPMIPVHVDLHSKWHVKADVLTREGPVSHLTYVNFDWIDIDSKWDVSLEWFAAIQFFLEVQAIWYSVVSNIVYP